MFSEPSLKSTNNGIGKQSKAKFIQGHVREKLRGLPSGSVHTIITSPPYWGLRRYGTDPQVWPGPLPPCPPDEHEWSTDQVYRGSTTRRGAFEHFTNKKPPKEARWFENTVCARCGAWRGELGLEPTPDLYVEHIVEIFREARRVLRRDGTLWLNIGDTYASEAKGGFPTSEIQSHNRGSHFARISFNHGLKKKDLVGIPWRVALALQADGWYLRSDIIWSKTSAMPENVTDRPTKTHEYLFLLTRDRHYYFDHVAIQEPCVSAQRDIKRMLDQRGKAGNSDATQMSGPVMRNRRSVWSLAVSSFRGAHFATFPVKLVEPCVLAGTSAMGCCANCGAPYRRFLPKKHKDKWVPTCSCDSGRTVPCTVLDPFNGAATTGVAALMHGRNYVGIELKREYIEISKQRLREEPRKRAVAASTSAT